MLLSDIFTHLERGDLAHISMGSAEEGVISSAEYPAVLSHINLALTQLYSRLHLKTSQVLITQQSGVTMYPLVYDNAVSNPNAVAPFIQDAGDPFLDDVLKIEEVVTSEGEHLPVNDSNHEDSVFTPNPYTLQVPNPVNGEQLAVLYRARHRKLSLDNGEDPSTIEVELTWPLLEPLMLYVVSRMVRSRGTTESISEANALMGQYELMLNQMKIAGVLHTDQPTNLRMERNGWV